MTKGHLPCSATGSAGRDALGNANAVPDYNEQSKVINDCSDLLVEVFGERHARSAIGVGSLPFGITVESEANFEVG